RRAAHPRVRARPRRRAAAPLGRPRAARRAPQGGDPAVALKRVFASKLRGLTAAGPDGVQLGKVHDVVVTFPRGRQPRGSGIVVHVLGRRRRPIFVNANNISEITSTTVQLISTRISMRPFMPQTGEIRILAELLDRSVTEIDTGKKVRINDIAIARGPIG